MYKMSIIGSPPPIFFFRIGKLVLFRCTDVASAKAYEEGLAEQRLKHEDPEEFLRRYAEQNGVRIDRIQPE